MSVIDGMLVEHAALDGAAADMAATVRAMESRLDALDRELAPLRSQWTGGQQEAYQVAKSTWEAAMREMSAVLGQTHVAVQQSNADYAAADARGAARFG